MLRGLRIALALVGLPGAPVAAQELAPPPAETELVSVAIPHTRVSLVVPAGFDVSERLPGLEHLYADTAVVVREVPVSQEQVLDWLAPDLLQIRGLRRLALRDLRTADARGTLVEVLEDRDLAELVHWIAVLGSGTRSVAVVATTRESFVTRVRSDVMRILGSIEWRADDPVDPQAGYPFRVDRTGQLIPIPSQENRLDLVRSDQFTPLAPLDVRASVSRYTLPAPVSDLELHAHEHLAQSDHVSSMEGGETSAAAMGGLPGIELVANVLSFESFAPLVAYQLLVLDAEYGYAIQGFAPREQRDRWLPEFRALAASFRRAR